MSKSQAETTMQAYFEHILDEKFEDILELRKQVGIPLDGLDAEKNASQIPPPGFKVANKKILAKIDDICDEYDLLSNEWTYLFLSFIYFNEHLEDYPSVCMMETVEGVEMLNEYAPSIQSDICASYPLAIRINPYASIRDILAYVKSQSHNIKAVQDRFKRGGIKLGKVRLRNQTVTYRNQFIKMLSSKGYKPKEIAAIVSKEFNVQLDVGAIGKIISLKKGN